MESEDSKVFEGNLSNQRLANYLRDAAKTTVKKYLSHFQLRMFKEHYPELVRHDRKQCKVLLKDLTNQLGNSITEDLTLLFKEERVFPSLQKLDEAISVQESRTEGWIPSGNPEEDLRDHIYQIKFKHKQGLLKVYQDLKEENEQLSQELPENHNTIMGMRTEINNVNSEISKIFNELKDAFRNPTVPQFVP